MRHNTILIHPAYRQAVYLLIGASILCGCQRSDVPPSEEVLALRKAYLLAEEPEEILGLIEARESLNSGQRVCLLGRVGGVSNPWETGLAAFVIVDPSVDAVVSDGEHAGPCGAGCSFCAKEKADSSITRLARVELVDSAGQVVPVDARQILGLEEGSLVIVRGQGHIDSLGFLTVKADGVYPR